MKKLLTLRLILFIIGNIVLLIQFIEKCLKRLKNFLKKVTEGIRRIIV